MIKIKVALFDGRLLSSHSEQSETVVALGLGWPFPMWRTQKSSGPFRAKML